MRKFLNILVDLIIIYGSILLSYVILDQTNRLLDFNANFDAFKSIAPFIVFLYLVFMYTFGLYETLRRKLYDVIYSVFLTSVFLMVGIMAVCFFIRDGAFAFPRSVVLLSAALFFVGLCCWRSFLWYFVRKMHGKRRLLILGSSAEKLVSIILNKYSQMYMPTYYTNVDCEKIDIQIQDADEILLTDGIAYQDRAFLFRQGTKYGKEISFVPCYSDLDIMSSSFQKFDDIPTFHISRMEMSMEERALKRIFDLLLGSIAFFVALPIAFFVAFAVKMDGGSVFYMQERLTRGGRVFKVLKFRTMIPNAEQLSGPVLAGEDDPRITKVGRFIRAVRLDELPQILNILKGDMSIVGPRPERPFFTQQFEEEVPEYSYRLKVKAGLTGYAQVEGKYNTAMEDKLRYDLIYINNYSLWKDIVIILQTVKILFLKESTEGFSTEVSMPAKCKTEEK